MESGHRAGRPQPAGIPDADDDFVTEVDDLPASLLGEWKAKNAAKNAPPSADDLRNRIRASIISGSEFLRRGWERPAPLWGEGTNVLWHAGESLMLVGKSGLGKTTIAHQIVEALIGVRHEVLGYPVREVEKVLYLACDWPAQISDAILRLLDALPEAPLATASQAVIPPNTNTARTSGSDRMMCSPVGHHLRGRAAAEVQEVGRLHPTVRLAGVGDHVQGGQDQAGTFADDADLPSSLTEFRPFSLAATSSGFSAAVSASAAYWGCRKSTLASSDTLPSNATTCPSSARTRSVGRRSRPRRRRRSAPGSRCRSCRRRGRSGPRAAGRC